MPGMWPLPSETKSTTIVRGSRRQPTRALHAVATSMPARARWSRRRTACGTQCRQGEQRKQQQEIAEPQKDVLAVAQPDRSRQIAEPNALTPREPEHHSKTADIQERARTPSTSIRRHARHRVDAGGPESAPPIRVKPS